MFHSKHETIFKRSSNSERVGDFLGILAVLSIIHKGQLQLECMRNTSVRVRSFGYTKQWMKRLRLVKEDFLLKWRQVGEDPSHGDCWKNQRFFLRKQTFKKWLQYTLSGFFSCKFKQNFHKFCTNLIVLSILQNFVWFCIFFKILCNFGLQSKLEHLKITSNWKKMLELDF